MRCFRLLCLNQYQYRLERRKKLLLFISLRRHTRISRVHNILQKLNSDYLLITYHIRIQNYYSFLVDLALLKLHSVRPFASSKASSIICLQHIL